ncbi:MAG: ATP-binding cassette domain-containing protein [Chloroflexi bacterium]|nr:ATP-binding cassette domain-containing protein [Chloroflexota bacterium]
MLKINALHQIFNPGHINEVHALRGINLHLPPAQFVTVIGSNGAGKSTIFNAIAGVYPPTQGSIVIDGLDVTKWPEHRRAALVGRVFQDPMLGTAASMSIAQNLSLALLRDRPLRLRTGVTAARKKMFHDLLAPLGLGLEKRLDARVSLLSGGQRQALTLLMAVFARPKVLLLDEHTAALDPGTAVKILDLTKKIIAEQKLTTLMITHNMQQALSYGDRTLMLDSGQVVLDISAEEKTTMTVQDMVNKFSEIKQEQLFDDELLLSV